MRNAIILAAGKGQRMNSNLTKVMHPLANKPIIGHVVEKLEAIGINNIVVVVGYQASKVKDYLGDRVTYVDQPKLLGTANAVQQALEVLPKEGDTLIIYGDVALISETQLDDMYHHNLEKDLTILTVSRGEPGHYARVIRDSQGRVEKIVEYRDCTERESLIQEVATGVYCVKNQALFNYIPMIEKNVSNDAYDLSNIVSLMYKAGEKIQSTRAEDPIEVMGINDRIQLAKANQVLRDKINYKHMLNGVTMIDPSVTFIGMDVIIEPDVVIYPNCHIRGNSTIKSETIIYANCWIENSMIGSNCKIMDSRITESVVRNNVKIGPYAHIRMNSQVEDDNRIGNFVELKNTHLGFDSRCAHLTYLGDSRIGQKVNIGCGVVTVNYDGVNKNETIIEDGAFIGSNSNLIAPVKVGRNAVVTAGSTITEDVEENAMAFARTRQTNKPELGLKYKKKEK